MIIAVDTGGTKTLVTSFTNNSRSSQKHRFLTPKDPVEYVGMLAQIINGEYNLSKVTVLSIAIPGLIENQQISYCWNLPWQKIDLASLLQKKLSVKLPILLQNDANLAGLAEVHALKSPPEVGLYLTVSTGIGSGVIINGKIDPIMQRCESGQMMLEFDGILREWEKFASGRAIYETYGKYAHDIDDPHTWSAIADKISRGIIVLIPLLSPNIIIIGGSIGTHFARYHIVLEKFIKERLAPGFNMPQIVQAAHPQEAVLYGCNIYAQQTIR